MIISRLLDRGYVVLEKENGLNKIWLKCHTFANSIKTYDHVKTMLELLKGPYELRSETLIFKLHWHCSAFAAE